MSRRPTAIDLPLELFRCATEPPDQALAAWDRLLEATPLDDFGSAVFRFLPAVWRNLKRGAESFPEEARLRGIYRRCWVSNSQSRQLCYEVLDLFESHQLPTLVLKGLAFNHQLYPDIGCRPCGDFDLLVPYERADEAMAMIAADGWTPIDYWTPNDRLHHGRAWQKGHAQLDLHWFLLREARWPQADLPFWNDAVPLDLGRRQAMTLSPTHHLLHLLVIADREPHERLRYLLDLWHLLESFRPQLDLSEVARLMRERRVLSRLEHLPLESMGLDQLRNGSPPGWLDRSWSQASRSVHDGSHEWHYLMFPLLDYWLHYHNREPGWGLLCYLQRRLELNGPVDLLRRTTGKLFRLVTGLQRRVEKISTT
jgi:hypothetical protein